MALNYPRCNLIIRIQELINELQDQEKQHGNVEVKYEDAGQHLVARTIIPSYYKGKIDYILIY